MINVIDRVPALPGRVKVTHADGTTEYITIERADEPIEAGTPINKFLFDSIAESFDTLNKCKNATTSEASIAANKNILTFENGLNLNTVGRIIRFKIQDSTAIVTNIIPALSSIDDRGFKVTSKFSSSGGTSRNEYKAYDNDENTYASASKVSADDKWRLIVELPFKARAQEIVIVANNYKAGSTIEGSNDGENWTVLKTLDATASSKTKATTTSSITDQNFYKYYSFNAISTSVSRDILVYKFQISNAERYIFNSNCSSMINDKDIVPSTMELSVGGFYEAVFDGTNYVLYTNTAIEKEIEKLKTAIVALGGV